MLLVLDNTVLSNFALIERSALLALLSPGQLVTVEDAWLEWQTGVELGHIPLARREARRLRVLANKPR